MKREKTWARSFLLVLGGMLVGLWLIIVLGSVVRTAHAARRASYGGQISIHSAVAPLTDIDPRTIDSAYALAIAGLTHEPLYRLRADASLEPVLAAGPPVVLDRLVTVPLRSALLAHDGRSLTATDIVECFRELASPGVLGAYVVLPVRGARDRLRGQSVPIGIRVGRDRESIEFELSVAYPEFPKLLAAPHALIGAPARPKETSSVGTGPFRLASPLHRTGALRLVAFPRHREGRPYLDAIEIVPVASRFATMAMVEERRAQVVLGVPDGGPTTMSLFPWPSETAPRELIVLSIGRRLLGFDSEEALLRVDRSIGRERIVSRHLGNRAMPVSTLIGTFITDPSPSPSGPPSASRSPAVSPSPSPSRSPSPSPPLAPSTFTLRARTHAELIVPREARFGQKVSERLQLDLLRAGVSAEITRLPGREVEARRRTGDFDLMLHALFSNAPSEAPLELRFHGLLAIAVFGGCQNVIADAEIEAFGAASSKTRERILSLLDARIRQACRLVPIAVTPPSIFVRSDVAQVFVDGSGRLAFEDAELRVDEARP